MRDAKFISRIVCTCGIEDCSEEDISDERLAEMKTVIHNGRSIFDGFTGNGIVLPKIKKGKCPECGSSDNTVYLIPGGCLRVWE